MVKEPSLRLDNFDARVQESENVEVTSAAPCPGDTVTIGPCEDTEDEAKLRVPGISDKSDARDANTCERLLRRDVAHSDSTLLNSARLWSTSYGLEMGDMVWGKVKSHPWWPGYILDEAFATPSVRRRKKDGHVLVAFFDSSYGWFDPAELIPYKPHFFEKSKQTDCANFLKAVEESVDEACRRSALGLTCFCRNSNIFRATHVPKHIFVDVLDHDPDGIYSYGQIRKARENFQPKRSLSFIQQLAAAPKEDIKSLDFATNKATALAYRRATFKEFDEPYAQVFRQESVRPVVAPLPGVNESVQAHSSGPLATVESLRGYKNSTNTDEFERGDEPSDAQTCQMLEGNSSSLASSCEDGQSTKVVGDYIFQKDKSILGKAVRGAAKEKELPGTYTDGEVSVGQSTHTTKESDPCTIKSKKVGCVLGLCAEKFDLGLKKKRRTADSPGSSGYIKKFSSAGNGSGASDKGESSKPNPIIMRSSGPAEKKKGKLQQVLADLKALAVGSFHGWERNRQIIAKKLILRFRSLVYKKSLAAPPLASGDTKVPELQSARTASGDAGKNNRITPPLRLSKPLSSSDFQTKGGKKRAQTEHLEDLAAKRAKKVDMRLTTTSKQKAPEMLEPTLKKARLQDPTFLEMKYPSGTSMPSSAELKARFGCFGPMDTSQNRVFYMTNLCRILFLYKEDAESAYRYCLGNKSDNPNVRFTLKPNRDASIHHGQPTPTVFQPSSTVQLKSCLKKPAGDKSGNQNSADVRCARVRFNVGDARTQNGSASLLKTGPRRSHSSSTSPAKNVRNNQQSVALKRPLSDHHPPQVEVAPRNPSIDISLQMLSLLTRCNDVVANVKSILGYTPYHAL